VKFGTGGYDDAMTGFSFNLYSHGGSCGDFWGTWTNRPKDAQWTERDQIDRFGAAVARVRDLMKAAKVSDFTALKSKPIEITFEAGRLKSWRILTEVL
jgi:hypothetical protein